MTYQLMLFPDFKDKAVTLSYDDGSMHDIRLVEIMNRHGLKGTFNVNSGNLGGADRLTKEQVRSVYLANGHEVAAHGVRHLSLCALTNEQIVAEIFNDRIALEDATGELITGMAYANGSYDDRVAAVLKTCGIDYARTTVNGSNFDIDDDWLRLKPTCHHNDGRLSQLVERFLDDTKKPYFWSNMPKLFYLWGHSHEFARDNNWEIIEDFAKKVGDREDIWYATNMEIYRYVEAFNALKYSADGKRAYNPTAITVYGLKPWGGRVVYPAGKEITL